MAQRQGGQLMRSADEEAIRVVGEDGEQRMRSTVLAELLEYTQHQVMMELIARHEANLNQFNRLLIVRNRPAGGGREWDEYWLTEAQYLYLMVKSQTDVANAITVKVIKPV
jgi:CRISPR/Cas system-associated endonuclease/helicase Cas3